MTDGFLFRTSRLETVAAQSNGDLKQDCQTQGGKGENCPLSRIWQNPVSLKALQEAVQSIWSHLTILTKKPCPPIPLNCLDLLSSLISTYLSHCQPADDS